MKYTPYNMSEFHAILQFIMILKFMVCNEFEIGHASMSNENERYSIYFRIKRGKVDDMFVRKLSKLTRFRWHMSPTLIIDHENKPH